MKIQTKDIRAIKQNGTLMAQQPDRKACNSLRNLVTYVNKTYPVEGFHYTVHVEDSHMVHISLVPDK